MKSKRDHPGVYIPPPLIYVAVFLIALILQFRLPLSESLFHYAGTKIVGVIVMLVAIVFFLFRSLRQFFRSNNTVVTMLPAHSLQTTGIYSVTRNPMYVGLSLLYLGIACIIGNWWNFFLFPLLLLIVQEYVIKREEKYLVRRFGEAYLDYRRKVRRWI
ncbi:MAG TPA: isoprenylcysteine carboxylmethyltransferase family protein [Agriterribacter sp.]|nr:isoprenylcysteine carboxylmethyltransferase family protein [Chitinophagaceae bacterium]HRP32563.1 isoprenylcysteine carboxylmethyltransferase family protein [Agriterribacter sp.]